MRPVDRPTIVTAVDAIAKAVLLIALLGELGAVLANVFVRALFNHSFLWTDEISRLALSTLTFVGGAVAYRQREHTFVRSVVNRLPESAQEFCLALADSLVLLTAIVTTFASVSLVEMTWSEATSILGMRIAWIGVPLMLSMALIGVYAAEHLWRVHRTIAPAITGALFVMTMAALGTRDAWSPWLSGDTPVVVSLGLFFIAVLAGLPVAFALLLSTACYLWTADVAPMMALAQNMVNGTSNFVLLALPFFIFAGLVMERGGLSVRLVRFVHAMVGHLRGGVLQVMVVSMYLVSGLSGSKAADVAAVGTAMRDMLKRERYGASEGAAVLAASAAMGETVPPSIAMLVLGSITKLSMAALFIGGLLPAAVIAVCLMALIYVRARIANAPRLARSAFRPLAKAGLGAMLPLLMPVILFAGILAGVATPTEVSSFAVAYGVFLAVVVYRELNLRQFLDAAIDSAVLTGMVLFILAAASAFSWALTIAYIPQGLVELLRDMHNSVPVFLIGSILLLIVTGSLLEGLPALNVLAPLLLPIAGKLGVSELHYGIVLLIAMGIGAFMPPTGVGFYVCCAIMRTSIEEAGRAMMPYLVCLLIGLLIVTFVPWVTLVLPNAFGFRG